MNRVIITLATITSYIVLIVILGMHDFLKYYLPKFLTVEGYLPENLEGVHGLALDLYVFCIVLIAFYVGYAALSDAVPTTKRYLWAWILFLGNYFVIPYFWYYYVWNRETSNNKINPDAQDPRAA